MKTLLTFLASCVVSLCPVDARAQDNEPFKIGVMVCLTGACAEWGTSALEGVRLATEEVNASGGVLGQKIELIVEDTQENDNKMRTVAALQSLLGKGIKYFIGPTWSEAGSVLTPILLKREEVIVVSPTLGVADFNEASPNFFNTMLHSITGTYKLARFARTLGYKKAAIFSTQQVWCIDQARFFEEEFKRAGGEIVAKVETLPTAQDIRPEVIKVMESKPEIVFSTDMAAAVSSPKELRKAGYKGPYMMPLVDQTTITKNGDAIEGTYYYSDYSGTSEFERKFEAKYNHKPTTGADTGYNALLAIAGGVNEAKNADAKVVREVVLKRTFPGATGIVKFDDRGGIVQDPDVYQIKGGQRVKISGR